MKIQCLPSDIISTLPQNIIETILTLMSIRDAVRTSILSSKWRYNWVKIPKLVFDDKMLVGSTSNNHMHGNYDHFFAINQVLLLHQGPILEFTLDVMGEYINPIAIYQIILLLSRNTTLKKFTLHADPYYELPSSFYSLHQLTHLDLKFCRFKPPSTFNGFNMLMSLSFDHVRILDDKMLICLISGYPILKHFTLEGFHIISSFREEASIVDQLFKCLNAFVYLNLSYHSTRWPFVGNVPRKLPTSFIHLKRLDLSEWHLMKKDEFCLTLLLIRSSPNLEKFKIKYWLTEDEMEEIMVFHVLHDYADVRLDHLIEFEIENFDNSIAESELLKLILVKSPMLKKVYLKLDYLDYKFEKAEKKMLRRLICLPRASHGVEIFLQGPRDDDEDYE